VFYSLEGSLFFLEEGGKALAEALKVNQTVQNIK
jgi:hypothetical protein